MAQGVENEQTNYQKIHHKTEIVGHVEFWHFHTKPFLQDSRKLFCDFLYGQSQLKANFCPLFGQSVKLKS